MSRKTGRVETPEYASFVRRMIRAYGRRVADADPEDLAEMLKVSSELDAAITNAISGQRQQTGRSWADIAKAAGVTRSAAYQRWGKPTTHIAGIPVVVDPEMPEGVIQIHHGRAAGR